MKKMAKQPSTPEWIGERGVRKDEADQLGSFSKRGESDGRPFVCAKVSFL